MAKKIGAENQSEQDDLRVEALSGLDDQESAELIAQHFASISQEYLHSIQQIFQPSFQHFLRLE